MRLALITQDFPPAIGGIQTYSFEIAKRIFSECDDFIVIAPKNKYSNEIDKSLPFKVYRIPCPNTWLGIASLPAVPAIFKRHAIGTTFHVQWQTLMISVLAKKLGLVNKITAAAHEREYYFNPFSSIKLLAKQYENYKKNLLKYVDCFFPVSSNTIHILKEHNISEEKMRVVMNGVNIEQFYPMDMDKLKQKYNLSGKKIITTISRLIPGKGIDTVLKAMTQLSNKMPELHYVIAGNGKYKKELMDLSESLGIDDKVSFMGKVPYSNIVEFYNLCDIYVMPSEAEAFGLVFLEANACGKPVIGSKVGGIPDAVIDGKTGLLVEPKQPAELTKALDKLLSDQGLAERMGKEGRLRAENELNWNISAAKISDYLKNKI